jgi:hypothetical protein
LACTSGESVPVGVVRVRMVARMISISSMPSIAVIRQSWMVRYGFDVETALRPNASAAYPGFGNEYMK